MGFLYTHLSVTLSVDTKDPGTDCRTGGRSRDALLCAPLEGWEERAGFLCAGGVWP